MLKPNSSLNTLADSLVPPTSTRKLSVIEETNKDAEEENVRRRMSLEADMDFQTPVAKKEK